MNSIGKIIFVFFFFFFAALPSLSSESTRDLKQEALLLYNGMVAYSNPKTFLPESHQGDPRLKEWCHTYDASIAILAFLAMEDIPRAQKIIDFYVGNNEIRRLGGVIEAVLNFSPSGKGINWQVRTGSNAWLGIAAVHCYLATREGKYLEFAQKQADFLLSYQDLNPISATYGGVPLGPKGVEYNPKDQRIHWKEESPEFANIYSTEGNVDVWALLNMLSHETSLPKYKMARERVEKWLKLVGFNAAEKRMNRGYYFEPDLSFAPDTHFWMVNAFGLHALDKWEPSLADQLMDYAQKRSFVKVEYKIPNAGTVWVRGFDFIDTKDLLVKERGKVVSPEWTFQAAVAYQLLSEQTENKELVEHYQKLRLALIESILSMAQREKGKAFLPYATKGDIPIGHEYNTPQEGTQSLIGAAWGILALLDYDPLYLPKIRDYWNTK